MIVIDVGCAKWGGDESIPSLVAEFEPDVLLGLDPGTETRNWWCEGTYVVEQQMVGWIFDGWLPFTVANLGGHVGGDWAVPTRCYDMARMIREAANTGHEVILKLDCEGGEYEIIPHLVKTNTDGSLNELLVEWHCECGYGIWNGVHPDLACGRDFGAWLERRDALIASVRCPIREWTK